MKRLSASVIVAACLLSACANLHGLPTGGQSVTAQGNHYILIESAQTTLRSVANDGGNMVLIFDTDVPDNMVFFDSDGIALKTVSERNAVSISGLHSGVLVKLGNAMSFVAVRDGESLTNGPQVSPSPLVLSLRRKVVESGPAKQAMLRAMAAIQVKDANASARLADQARYAPVMQPSTGARQAAAAQTRVVQTPVVRPAIMQPTLTRGVTRVRDLSRTRAGNADGSTAVALSAAALTAAAASATAIAPPAEPGEPVIDWRAPTPVGLAASRLYRDGDSGYVTFMAESLQPVRAVTVIEAVAARAMQASGVVLISGVAPAGADPNTVHLARKRAELIQQVLHQQGVDRKKTWITAVFRTDAHVRNDPARPGDTVNLTWLPAGTRS
ncbi:MAG: hypothetical protein WBD34_08170 [Burkholderiaceae bacterium]